MNASELYRAGRLDEAIAAQTLEVRAAPADQGRRVFLFELLAFAGDLERARRQLDAMQYDDSALQVTVGLYRKLLEAEEQRRRVFAGERTPELVGAPPEHVRLRLDALARLRDGQPAEAASLLAEAEEHRPHVAGQLNGAGFNDLRDADDLFAGVLEVFAQGRYLWVPLETIELVAINPPRFPRDLLWVPAQIEAGGQSGAVFLPALYPGTHEHGDDPVRLGRATDWTQAEGGPVLGRGVHQFLADDEAPSLLEWRELRLDAAPGS
jgi:type VI secretion system protein ImpE